ncbi:meteorin-like protein [Gracilinanus agilis]|uniref:meteorin-like protein n=1 Tax=Gracilinanus agilis TaxID=191870 RepID=UPI001CFD4CCE|nr:meteorin-like protein [Gracilinanus agilis]
MVGIVLAVRGPARQLWPSSPLLLLLLLFLLLLLLLCKGASAQYSSNMCNWKGSHSNAYQFQMTESREVFNLFSSTVPCRPCSDTEVLLAVCTSDFVVRGSIQNVTNEPEQQESIIDIHVSKLYRQKNKVFQVVESSESWQGQIKTLLECGVKPGNGDFLFTGRMHFGEARLSCAPCFKDFLRMYKDAENKGLNPCEIGTV